MSNIKLKVTPTVIKVVVQKSGVQFITKAGNEEFTDATNTVTIIFGTQLTSKNYSVSGTMVNTADTNPLLQALTVVARSKTQFTLKCNAPVLSGNYSADWIIAEHNDS